MTFLDQQQTTKIEQTSKWKTTRRRLTKKSSLLFIVLVVVVVVLVSLRRSHHELLVPASIINETGQEPRKQQQQSTLVLHVGPHKTATTMIQETLQEPRKQQQQQQQPTLVLHVGPHKTATTMIQETLYKLQKDGYLEKDGYVAVENNDLRHALRAGCAVPVVQALRRNHSAHEVVDCWSTFTKEMKKHYEAGKSVIISNEGVAKDWKPTSTGLSSIAFSAFNNTFQNWNVKVVATYRRYWSWLLSLKNQSDKTPLKVKGYDCPKSLESWIQPWLTEKTRRKANLMGTQFHYVDMLAEMFKKNGYPIEIINYHNTSDIVSTFMCDHVPNARTACNKSLHKTEEKLRINEKRDITYYQIACAAARGNNELGIDKFINRDKFASNLEEFHKGSLGNNKSLPILCLNSTTLDLLLNQSIELEKRMVPNFYELNKKAIVQEFQEAVKENQFCQVNAEAVLEDDVWKNYIVNHFGHN